MNISPPLALHITHIPFSTLTYGGQVFGSNRHWGREKIVDQQYTSDSRPGSATRIKLFEAVLIFSLTAYLQSFG